AQLPQRKDGPSLVQDSFHLHCRAKRNCTLESEIKSLKAELESERKRSAEQSSKIKYLQADIINIQKQSDRMIADARNQAKLNWIVEILSIQEDLQRAIEVDIDERNKALVSGLQMVLSRIENLLDSEDVRLIRVERGQNFDPHYHEAVAFTESEKGEEGKVLSVVGNGYTIGGKVIKPALVEVSRKATSRNEGKEVAPSPAVNDAT
ncbi:MAG: nucleotide exchange factor GrpE, partial [Thaumarchaeota archaeon]|nr:nucleotide exchange factor GrpE [Nitrososphaerota archaeon]